MSTTVTLPDTFEDRCAELDDQAAASFRHEDGSFTFVVYDDSGDTESPRGYGADVATLIQTNPRCIDVDSDDAGLSEARDRWDYLRSDNRVSDEYVRAYLNQTERRIIESGEDRDSMVRRYLAMFRPDIALYVDYWSAGDSHGWGYVTTEALTEAGLTLEWMREHDMTPESIFDAEVRVYGQWCEGEVYGYVHVTPGQALTSLVVDFAPDDEDRGHEYTEESVWGFLGYDDLRDIATDATTSPVVAS